jgi:hypothetical protein
MAEVHTLTIAQRVVAFLRENAPAAFCDDCIADRLGFSQRQQANRVTGTLALTARFRREIGACSLCSQTKKVIRYAARS